MQHEKAGSGARRYRVARNSLVVIGIFLLQNIDEPLAADHVHPASLRVVEKVVGVADNFGRRHCLSRFRVIHQQARRHAASCKQAVMSLVKRHRETRRRGGCGPAGDHASLCKVGDFDLFLVWNIHENAGPDFLKLKRFGVGIHNDLGDLFPVGVQNPQRPASFRPPAQRLLPAVTDDHMLAAGVVANVVGVVGELHCLKNLKCGSIVDPGGAVTAGDEQPIGRGIVELPLRLLQTRKRPHSLAGLQVDHFGGVIAQGGHEQTLALHIDAEVIHPSIDARERDAGFQRQRRGILPHCQAA